MKKIIAALIAVLLAGMGVTALATASSAHTGDLDVSAVCQTDGTYLLTATLKSGNTNLTGATKWRIGTSTFQGTPSNANGMNAGPSLPPNYTVTLGTTTLPGTTTGLGPWFYAYTTWTDGFGYGSDGQLTKSLKGDCSKPDSPTATASVEVKPPTCALSGLALVSTAENVGLVTLDQSIGKHSVTFTANSGFVFPGGAKTKVVEYEILGPNTGIDCYEADAKADIGIVPATCTAPAHIEYSDGNITNATFSGTPSGTAGPGSYTVTATAISGHKFDTGLLTQVFTGTLAGKVVSDDCLPPVKPIKVTPTGSIDDRCGVEDDSFTLGDEAGIDYHYDGERFVTATPLKGYVLDLDPNGLFTPNEDGTATADMDNFFTDEPCDTPPPPVLIPGTIGAVCQGDVPYLGYAVTPVGGTAPDGPVTITFSKGANSYTLPGTYPLSGSVLWPGASASPKQWPGWTVDGLTKTDDPSRFGWTREGVTVTFEVNPTYSTVVAYPAATSLCANPPAVTQVGNTATPTAALAATGSSPLYPLLAAAALVLVGTALTLARRRKGKHTA